jgi:glucose-1-phosphate adenylyltransferase
MKRIIAMILAGGQGDRLSVLSEARAKPAVVFGGRYRIIDFTLSNCANSGLNHVSVLTQYRPRSLNEHIGIGAAWDLDRLGSHVSILQPYLGGQASDWYSGTADAIFQNWYYVEESRADDVLILAGDHVYKMAYDELIDFHRSSGADVTVPVQTVPMEEAHRFGTLTVEDSGRVTAFDEKPAQPRSNLISMGIYLFRKDALIQALIQDTQNPESEHDFGRDILPALVRDPGRKVYGYRFDGYWRDVGTIEAYFQANMDLLADIPELNLYDPDTLIKTPVRGEPPVKAGKHSSIEQSLLSEGTIVNGRVERSILSPGVYIEKGAVVRDSILFHGTRVDTGAVVERSILDKEVHVGKDARVGYGDDWTPNRERPDIVNSGVTIVGKRARIPAHVVVGRNCVIGPEVNATPPEGQQEIASGTTMRRQQRIPSFSV